MFPFVFDPVQVWDGLISSDGRIVCNGLIRDVASWQKENGPSFENLKATLLHLSPNSREPITFGPSTRISVDEVRDIPTVSTGYGEPVAILHASSGIKRIFAMAYMLVWAWEEHKRAAEFRQTAPFKDMLLLIDELESHLHPSWQRQILPALLTVTNTLSQEIKIQLIATTHSPLIMASLEPIFDAETDAWFDLDLVGENGHREVKLEKREFEIRGDANKWLMSKAFDLNSSRSEEAEEVLARAANALEKDTFDREEIEEIQAQMNKYLPPSDVFFIKWDMLGKKKGWWE